MTEPTERIFNFGSVDMQESARIDAAAAELEEREFPLAECIDRHPDHPFSPLLEFGFAAVRIGGDVAPEGTVQLRVAAIIPLGSVDADLSEYQLEARCESGGDYGMWLAKEGSGTQELVVPVHPEAWGALEDLHDSLVRSLEMPEGGQDAADSHD